jgi:antitoxin CptB
MSELESLKKKLLYRSNYRGTKEMDMLLSNFVRLNIEKFTESQLYELEEFLNFEDEDIYNYYQNNISNKKIDNNSISVLLKKFNV